MYEFQFTTFSLTLLLQVDYNENEEQFFLNIMNAVERNLSVGESIGEVTVDIETNIEEEEDVIKHRALTSKRGKFT